MPPAFPWADGWILASIALTRPPVSLAALVRTADAINHAIPTAAELNGALDRLHALGLVHVAGGSFSLTEAGSGFVRSATGREDAPLAAAERLQEALNRAFVPLAAPAAAWITESEIAAVL